MMRRIYAVALNTFRDAIRHRVLYGILAVVIGLNLFGIVLGEMSWNEEARVARDIGLAGVSLFGSITAIVLGVSLLYTEIQKRTIHTIVSKPLERWEFVVGKYLGMAFTLTLLVGLFAAALTGLLLLQDVPFTAAIGRALLLGFTEVLVVAAVAVFFSSFSSPFLSGIFTFAVFYVGRVTPEMRAAMETTDSELIRRVAEIGLLVVPDLHLYAVSGGTVAGEHVSVHNEFVNWGYTLVACSYGLLWIAMLLLLAVGIFSRRDFV